MKKLLSLILALGVTSLATAVETAITMNIDGVKSQNEILPDKNNSNVTYGRFNWLKKQDDQKYTLIISQRESVSSDWKKYTFSFTPERTGTVYITVRGNWVARSEERRWILINKIEKDGRLMENGDFASSKKTSNGKRQPLPFWLQNEASYLSAGGEDGSAAIVVNFENPVTFSIETEGGKHCTIQIEAKVGYHPKSVLSHSGEMQNEKEQEGDN